MSLSFLLLVSFLVALLLIFGSILFSIQDLWQHLGILLPATIRIGQYIMPTYIFIFENAIVLFILILLIFIFFLWLIHHFIIKPINIITVALTAFTEHGTEVQIPPYASNTTEMHILTKALVEFTKNVEKVHNRDMDISRVKSDFISTAAHQLRTPLTGIRWALEALQKEAITEDQKALVTSALDKSHDLVAIVGTLLDISSIESGKYKYNFEMVDVSNLLETLAKDFSVLSTARNVSIYYENNTVPIPPITVDHERIKWVLNNLIENAIRYTPAGGSVRLYADSSNGKVYIRVKDTGIGIQEKDRNNIFERFFRAGNAIAKENQGNGLGLYIARQIALDHGGDLTFESNQDSTGTTFILSIPVAK